jgi:hypothetical protein
VDVSKLIVGALTVIAGSGFTVNIANGAVLQVRLLVEVLVILARYLFPVKPVTGLMVSVDVPEAAGKPVVLTEYGAAMVTGFHVVPLSVLNSQTTEVTLELEAAVKFTPNLALSPAHLVLLIGPTVIAGLHGKVTIGM